MPNDRLRRSADAPHFVRKEVDGRRYPYHKDIHSYRVEYRRERWRDPLAGCSDDPDERPTFRRRKTFGWLFRDDEKIGAIEVREYDLCAFDCNETLWRAADMDGFDAGRVVYVLCSQWRDLGGDVAAYGTIVELVGLWLLPSEHAVRGASILDEFLQKTVRRYSIIVLKAFPLEYESRLGDRPELIPAFERRLRAMQRHYARSLSMISFPSLSGEGGWMWKPAERLKKIIPAPVYSDDPFADDEC